MDAGPAVERGVRTHQYFLVLESRQASGGGDRIGNQPACPTRGATGPSAQALGYDHRGRLCRGDRRQQSIEPTDTGVAEAGALFLVAVDFDDGVVDIDEDIPAGGSWGCGYQGWGLVS